MNYRKQMVKSVHLETWSSPEVKNHLLDRNSLAIIPVGSFEQHGPHAPLGTDTFISIEVSKRLARKFGGVVVPPVWFGISDEHMDFAGTITISPDTLCNLIAEIVISLKKSGFDNIVVLNGHASNEKHLEGVRERVSEREVGELNLLIISYWDRLSKKKKKQLSSLDWGLHANEYETSIVASIIPSIVKKLQNIDYVPDPAIIKEQELNEELFKNLIKNSNGVWGRPSRASISKGVTLLALIEATLTNFLERSLNLIGMTSIQKNLREDGLGENNY